MDGRIDDEDGDALNPFFTTSPLHSSSYSHSHSENWALSSPPNLLDDDAGVFNDYYSNSTATNARRKKFSPDQTSASTYQNYQNAPKVFDRFDESSSSSDENDEFLGSESRNEAVQKRLDYMIQLLDRNLSLTSSPSSVD